MAHLASKKMFQVHAKCHRLISGPGPPPRGLIVDGSCVSLYLRDMTLETTGVILKHYSQDGNCRSRKQLEQKKF